MWILYAVLSSFFAGITSILAKCGIKETDTNIATAIRTGVVLVFSWFMVWITGAMTGINDIDFQTLLFLILSGLATGASWLCYFRALQLGDVNKVVPIDKFSTVLTILLAVIFLNEPLTWKKVLAMIAISVGTWLMITKTESTHSEKDMKNRWLIYAALSAVFAAATALLGKIGITHIPSNLGTAIRTTVVLVMAWMMVFVTGKQKEVKKIEKGELIFIVLSGFATGASWLCYYHALQEGLASVVVPIDKLSILITIIFSWLVLKEKLSKKALAGIISIVLGTMLLIF